MNSAGPLAGKAHRSVWMMPRGVYALERGGDVVAIGWLWSLERRYQPGDVVLVSPATLADLDAGCMAQAA